MASTAAPTAAVPTLDPPLEQIRRLAVELRLLLPGVRGELTPWGLVTAGAGSVREEAGCGAGGGGGGVAPLTCALPFATPGPHATPATVGEAREATKEFNAETFWRRLRECLSYWGPLFLIPSRVLTTPFPPAPPSPPLPPPHPLSPLHFGGWDTKH